MRNAVVGRAAGPDQYCPDHHHRADDCSHAWADSPGLCRAGHFLCCPGQSLGFARLSPSHDSLEEAW